MGVAQDYSVTHPHKDWSWKNSQGTSGQRPCQRPLVGISVPFTRHSIWGLSNSQQCLGCLQYPVNHQHNQIQRLSRRTDLKGLLPYPDNSMSLKTRVTVCPTPGCILEQWPDSAHFPAEKGRWFSHLGLQEAQGRRPRKLEATVGRHNRRVPRSQGTQSQLQGASWLDLAKASKANSTILSFFCLGKMSNLTETISSCLK